MSHFRVRVTPELVAQMLETGNEIQVRCVKGLPRGARMVSVQPFPAAAGFHRVDMLFDDGDAAGPAMIDLDPVFERIERAG